MPVSSFKIIPGDPDSHVILHVPHSSREIPSRVRTGILLDDAQLKLELDEMTDSHTDQLAYESAKIAGKQPWIFINELSRLVIDPERFPDDREAMNSVGMGAVYHKNSHGLKLRTSEFDQELLDKYFHPYALAIEALVNERLLALNRCLIIDVHSYRPIAHANSMNKDDLRPAICIGTDPFHTSRSLYESARSAFAFIGDIVENQPYSGTYVPLKHYEKDARVEAIMMEIRADTFLDDVLTPTCGLAQIVAGLQQLVRSAST